MEYQRNYKKTTVVFLLVWILLALTKTIIKSYMNIYKFYFISMISLILVYIAFAIFLLL